VWPELDEAPPRPAELLLEDVLQRGHALRREARRQRQVGWLGRAAVIVAVAGLAATLARATTDDPAGSPSGEVAAPVTEGTAGPPTSAGDPTTTVAGAPGPTGPADGTTDTSALAGGVHRQAPLAVLEQRGADGRYRSVVLRPDGELVPITAATADRQMPVLSPQGDLVAYQLLQPHPLTGQPRWEVFTVRADGTDQRQVTGGVVEGGPQLVEPPLGAGNRWPSWSPDGRRLTFSCSGTTGLPVICITRADGSGRRSITREGDGFYQPTWSPDGRAIAAKREAGPGLVGLWLLNPNGGAATSLPVGSIDPRGVRLSWSGDGRELVYAQVDQAPFGLVILDVTTGERRVVPTPTPARFPIVCGEDQVLYLQSDRGLDDTALRTGPLVLVGEDGSSPTTVLPADPDVEHLPSSCAAR
jgi:hypothetical protein